MIWKWLASHSGMTPDRNYSRLGERKIAVIYPMPTVNYRTHTSSSTFMMMPCVASSGKAVSDSLKDDHFRDKDRLGTRSS